MTVLSDAGRHTLPRTRHGSPEAQRLAVIRGHMPHGFSPRIRPCTEETRGSRYRVHGRERAGPSNRGERRKVHQWKLRVRRGQRTPAALDLSAPAERYVVRPTEPVPVHLLTDPDPLVRPLAETMRNSVIRATTGSLSSELIAAGMTPELQKTWEAEMDDTRYDPTERMYFVWARKRV